MLALYNNDAILWSIPKLKIKKRKATTVTLWNCTIINSLYFNPLCLLMGNTGWRMLDGLFMEREDGVYREVKSLCAGVVAEAR